MSVLETMAAALPRVRPLWLVVQAYKKFLRDDALTLSAAIAYSALFSIFPLLLAVVAVVGSIVDQVEVRAAIMQTLLRYLPRDTAEFVDRNIAQVFATRGTFGVLAVIGLFWSATAVAGSIRHALNQVHGIPTPRPLLWRKMIELALMLTAGASLIISLVTSEAVLRLSRHFPRLADAVRSLESSAAGHLLSPLLSLLFSGLTFLVIYRYLPNVRMRWANALIGASVGCVLFEIAKRGFFWYVATFSRYHIVYGSIAGIIVFLVWMFLSAAILIYGAELATQVGKPHI